MCVLVRVVLLFHMVVKVSKCGAVKKMWSWNSGEIEAPRLSSTSDSTNRENHSILVGLIFESGGPLWWLRQYRKIALVDPTYCFVLSDPLLWKHGRKENVDILLETWKNWLRDKIKNASLHSLQEVFSFYAFHVCTTKTCKHWKSKTWCIPLYHCGHYTE